VIHALQGAYPTPAPQIALVAFSGRVLGMDRRAVYVRKL
jgi:hypothetical protein